MRLTLHCFHRKHIILRPCSDIPAPKTTPGPVKEAQTHSYTLHWADGRPENNQNNPTSSLINMRSTLTSRNPPSSLTCLGCRVVSYRQKREINTQLIPKLNCSKTKPKRKAGSGAAGWPFSSLRALVKMIAGLGKWREGDQFVTMWVNEGRLPLNVNI